MTNWTTQDRIKVSVSSIPGRWTKIAGQEAERETQKKRPGAGEEKVTISTSLDLGDITLTRMFDADVDVDLVKSLYAGAFPGTDITETFLDADGNAIPGKTLTHYGCSVVSFTQPEADADGSDPGELTITWARTGVR